MFNICLFEPEIPANTGNIIRLCANTGCTLHLIHPLGFNLSEKKLRRAGLDYHDLTFVEEYESWSAFQKTHSSKKIYAVSTKGNSCYAECEYLQDDFFLFGPETRGLPSNVLASECVEDVIKIPMVANSRSLNLSNSVAVVAYEAWRQLHFQQ